MKPRYVSVTALVLGSMAPDFEYVLHFQPNGVIGHIWLGFLFELTAWRVYCSCILRPVFSNFTNREYNSIQNYKCFLGIFIVSAVYKVKE
ncbi:DUF4184 domain-containing protein [Bacillus cereus]|nr:DUF4184 domain-containing protein [Bacillus sp. AFS023182]PGY04346.1 DUF4184 domain-containing protein [Bacillus cereus]